MPYTAPQSSDRPAWDMAVLDPHTGRITVMLPDKSQMEKEAHSYYYPPGF